jgi:hypothetical protein
MLFMLFPLLFTFNHIQNWFPARRFPAGIGERFIHSPHRIVNEVGGISFVSNSTTPPVRTSASSVLMGFDVVTYEGARWNARILSSSKKECDLFLMDCHTLQPIVMAKLRVPAPSSQMDSTISLNVTVFDTVMFLKLVAASYWNKFVRFRCRKVTYVPLREDLTQHKQYARMVLNSGYRSYNTRKSTHELGRGTTCTR